MVTVSPVLGVVMIILLELVFAAHGLRSGADWHRRPRVERLAATCGGWGWASQMTSLQTQQ